MHLQSETVLFVHNKQLTAVTSTTQSLAEKPVPTKVKTGDSILLQSQLTVTQTQKVFHQSDTEPELRISVGEGIQKTTLKAEVAMFSTGQSSSL